MIPWSFIIPAAASVVGGIAAGRAKGREAEATTNLSRDQLTTQQNNTQQTALLNALLAQAAEENKKRAYQLEAPNQRGSTAVRGDMLARAQNFRIPDIGRMKVNHIQGGFGPSDFSPETRQLGSSMTRNALMSQLKGDDYDIANFRGAVLPQPGQTPLPQANAFDSALGVIGPALGIAGAIGQGYQDRDTAANGGLPPWLVAILNQKPTTAGVLSQRPQPMDEIPRPNAYMEEWG